MRLRLGPYLPGPKGFPGSSEVEESACNADPGSIPGLRRSLGEGNDNPLQYSCLENPMDRGAWQAIVHGVTKSWPWLKRLHFTSFFSRTGVPGDPTHSPQTSGHTQLQRYSFLPYLWREAELSSSTTSYLHPFIHNIGHTSVQISKRILAYSFARGKEGDHVTWSKLG